MTGRGNLGYDSNGLFCLMTGGSGHMPNWPIEVFLGAAGIKQGDEEVITTDDGEVLIRTPEAAAKAETEADRGLILRHLADDDITYKLAGTRVVFAWDVSREIEGLGLTSLLTGTFRGIDIARRVHLDCDGHLLRLCNGHAIKLTMKDIAVASTVWTSLGKPQGAKPPSFA